MPAPPSRLRCYLAGPLFSAAELQFNRQLAAALREYYDVFLPQEDGELLATAIAQGENATVAARRIFRRDVRAIREADVVVVVLDGRSVDEGAAFELGAAFALGKCCVGLQTDVRRLLPTGNNPMIDGGLTAVFTSVEELLVWARTFAGPGARSTTPQVGTDTDAARHPA